LKKIAKAGTVEGYYNFIDADKNTPTEHIKKQIEKIMNRSYKIAKEKEVERFEITIKNRRFPEKNVSFLATKKQITKDD
jgi:hypothetical protein